MGTGSEGLERVIVSRRRAGGGVLMSLGRSAKAKLWQKSRASRRESPAKGGGFLWIIPVRLGSILRMVWESAPSVDAKGTVPTRYGAGQGKNGAEEGCPQVGSWMLGICEFRAGRFSNCLTGEGVPPAPFKGHLKDWKYRAYRLDQWCARIARENREGGRFFRGRSPEILPEFREVSGRGKEGVEYACGPHSGASD